MLKGRHILVGISGGIAAYKIPELIRLLVKEGADVRVTCTRNALEFVTLTTLLTLTGHRVYHDVFAAINEHATEHISLPEWADMMLVAPATANVLGKMASGIADDALTTTFAAMRKQVVIAPAMNDKMYAHPATQQAMEILRSMPHVMMLDCAVGFLACGSEGKGRMQEIDTLKAAVDFVLSPHSLSSRRVLITAGPTIERLDPVRYISNFSSGKMGYALAKACLRRGAEVTLITGPTALSLSDWSAFAPIHIVTVESAQQMAEAALTYWPQMDMAILAAAVADFTPISTALHKIKKQAGCTGLDISMTITTDIAASMGQLKSPNQTLVGFALETDHEQDNAIHKMQSKNLDAIVLNSLRDAGAGFGVDTNKVDIILSDGRIQNLPLLAKEEVADAILSCLTQTAITSGNG